MASRALLDGLRVARAGSVADGAQLLALNDHVDGYASDERKQREIDVVVRVGGATVLPLLVPVVPERGSRDITGEHGSARTFQIRCRGATAS